MVGEFLRLTRPHLRTLQTYRIGDGHSATTYNSLDDLTPEFDRYEEQSVNISGGGDDSLQITRNRTTLIYKVSGSPRLTSEVAAKLEAVLNLPESFPEEPVIFIGHGRREDWKALRDHLRDQQNFRTEFFESESRAGLSIRQVLNAMRAKSGCAILVYTGEDRLQDGTMRPRPNVIHECGFFAAGLEDGRTLILREEGVEVPTNQAGEQYIEFPRGDISRAFAPVVARVRRLVPRA